MADSWPMFALRHPTGLRNVYPSRTQVRMCGTGGVDPTPVIVSLDEAGTFWGWMATGETRPTMIQTSRVALSICFPYSLDQAVLQGQGRAVRLRVEKALPGLE